MQFSKISVRIFLMMGAMFLTCLSNAQTLTENPVNDQNRKSQITPLPAISYSPETGFTFGIIGDYYIDLAEGDSTVSMSRLRLLSTVTSTKQFLFEPSWLLFTKNDDYRFSGSFYYRNYNDRNYGYGNTADAIVVNYKEKDNVWEADTSNFQKFRLKRWFAEAAFLKKIVPDFYVGPQLELDYVFKVANDSSALVQQAEKINQTNIEGFRSGIGINVTYDTRDKPNYPTEGTYAQLSNLFFTKLLGADVTYTALNFDVRQYIHAFDKHVFAARLFSNHRFGGELNKIPLGGWAGIGGRNLVRGYFEGTYQDRHFLTFDTEYRVPFTFLEKSFLPILGRLGAVVFFSGGQTFGDYNNFNFGDFHLSAGGGLRVNINKKETTNIRIDYGFGLSKNSAYNNKRQSGFYFFLSEAF